MYRPLLALTLLVLTACAEGEAGTAPTTRIIEDTGGHTILLINGVCIRQERTNDEDHYIRIAPVHCGV